MGNRIRSKYNRIGFCQQWVVDHDDLGGWELDERRRRSNPGLAKRQHVSTNDLPVPAGSGKGDLQFDCSSAAVG